MAKKKKSDFYEDIVNEVNKDYQKRQLMRRPYELAWQLTATIPLFHLLRLNQKTTTW